MRWEAEGSDMNKSMTSAFLLSLWDPNEKNTMKIDLWTKDMSIEEMKHADEVIDRILFLEGVPAISRYDVIKVGDTPREQIENGMELEIKGASTYNEGIKLCSEVKDNASRELMDRMVVESEQSIDWAEAQLDLIKMVGLENYLAQQMEGGGK